MIPIQAVVNDLNGKIALVTGAGRGLGRAIALAYCRVGCKVVGVARSLNDLRETYVSSRDFKGTFKYYPVDILKENDVMNLFYKIRDEFIHLDILVNNAGIIKPKTPIQNISISDWDAIINVNLRGVFLCMKEAIPLMKNNNGSIINLTSGVTTHPAPYWAHYAVSKFGVEVLTKIGAEELKGRGIKVNAVNPGRMRTRMLSIAFPDDNPRKYPDPKEKVNLFLYLASRHSTFINGQVINLEEWVSSHPEWKNSFGSVQHTR